MKSVLHKKKQQQLECKVKNLKFKKLDVMQPWIKYKSDLQTREQTIPDQFKREIYRTIVRALLLEKGVA